MSFYKVQGDSFVFDQDGEFVFVVPDVYFESRSAIIVGEFVNIMGVLNYYIEDTKGHKGPLKRFYFPSIFLTQPYTIEKVKGLQLLPNRDPEDYRLLRYRKGDKIVVHDRVPMDSDNAEELFRLFVITGHVPNTVPYNMLFDYFNDSIHLANASYGVSNQLLGILPTEICRDPNDLSRPFRLSKSKKEHKWTDYVNVSVKEVPQYVSPFVDLTSENFDESIAQAILMDPSKAKDTPLEKIMYTK